MSNYLKIKNNNNKLPTIFHKHLYVIFTPTLTSNDKYEYFKITYIYIPSF